MQIIPAIDIKGGRCVRLVQGDPDCETVYNDDPLAVAASFEQAGIRKLHIVDLDSALGTGENGTVIGTIIESVDIPIQVGGGIRDMHTIEEILSAGAAQAILGTAAIDDPRFARDAVKRFGAERITVSVDSINGRLAVRGWRTRSEKYDDEFIVSLSRNGVRRIIFTDINRDGTMSGLDLNRLRSLASGTDVSVTIAGGISCRQDIDDLAALENPRIDSVIVGKAFYEGSISLAEMAGD